MLELARKCGEQIVIPELGIVLTILQVRGERVRVGVDAPAELAIHRREVWDRIQRNGEPTSTKPNSLSLHRNVAPISAEPCDDPYTRLPAGCPRTPV